ncbi:MAG: hypothetical protein KDA61_11460, partial [Planctomycetales bacterium]|nr:hypothetical protein [Planctomycetales bacterium]
MNETQDQCPEERRIDELLAELADSYRSGSFDAPSTLAGVFEKQRRRRRRQVTVGSAGCVLVALVLVTAWGRGAFVESASVDASGAVAATEAGGPGQAVVRALPIWQERQR